MAAWIAFALYAQAQTTVVITPSSPPVVNQGKTLQFTANVPVQWSLAPGSQGSIDPDGTYHAPAKVTPQQVLGGCPLLPNSHVFNTRIDGLPKHAMSDVWMADANSIANGTFIGYEPSGFPVNQVLPTDPATFASFFYTPQNNGSFVFPLFPVFQFESGYFTWDAPADRHSIMLNPQDCTIEEIYNYYPAGFNLACPSCTSQAGTKYPMLGAKLPGGATDAAGMQVAPLILRMSEIQAGAIRHALRVTIQRPDQSFVWPAQSSGAYGFSATKLPMGSRVRLPSSFDVNTLTSPVARILATQLQQYGIILADRGANWDIQPASESFPDTFKAGAAELQIKIRSTLLEVVDESSLIADPASGDTTTGTIVVATNALNSSDVATLHVYPTGVTVGVSNATEVIQAGSAPKQLSAVAHGADDTSLSWMLSPAVGGLSSSGLYTPPASVSTPTTTTVTVTSNADPQVSATIVITVLPSGPIRINAGDNTDYVDSASNTWWGDDVPGRPIAYSQSSASLPGDLPSVWQNTADSALFSRGRFSYSDLIYKMTVPNGNYKVTMKFGNVQTALGQRLMNIDAQGQILFQLFDVFQAAQAPATAVDLPMRAAVTDGNLFLAIRTHGSLPTSMNPCCATPIYSAVGNTAFVSALSVEPVLQPVLTWNNPADIQFGGALGATQLNATSNVPGTFAYNPPLGTVLPVGDHQSLSVTFTPTDAITYSTAAATVFINVKPATLQPPSLVITSVLTRDPNTHEVVAQISMANNGGATAQNVQVNTAKIGTINTTTVLPFAAGNIPAGGVVITTLRFPANVGVAGARAVLTVGGIYIGGSFNSQTRVTLP